MHLYELTQWQRQAVNVRMFQSLRINAGLWKHEDMLLTSSYTALEDRSNLYGGVWRVISHSFIPPGIVALLHHKSFEKATRTYANMRALSMPPMPYITPTAPLTSTTTTLNPFEPPPASTSTPKSTVQIIATSSPAEPGYTTAVVISVGRTTCHDSGTATALSTSTSQATPPPPIAPRPCDTADPISVDSNGFTFAPQRRQKLHRKVLPTNPVRMHRRMAAKASRSVGAPSS